jgi:hypothetical protein
MPIAKEVTLPLADWADLEVPLLQVENGGGYTRSARCPRGCWEPTTTRPNGRASAGILF